MLYAVIMAGGSGTRFWPQSRKDRPKQLLTIAGGKPMIRATVERILPQVPFERIMVITGEPHAAQIRNQLPELGPNMILAEPVGKNTAPCVALAAYRLRKMDPTAIMAVLPADHLIGKQSEFLAALGTAAQVAATGEGLLTFGIQPHRPETGYGYIKLGPQAMQAGSTIIFKVDCFVEKPDRATAEQYLSSGEYVWNSGMFIWRVDAIISAFETHLPEISEIMERISCDLGTPGEAAAIERAYAELPSVSIDYGIMEKASNVVTIPVDVEWNDVGTWASLDEVWGRDEHANAVQGTVVIIDGKKCIVSSPSKLTALIGVEDLIVVDTPDALLICHKDRAQDVRKLQDILAEQGRDELL